MNELIELSLDTEDGEKNYNLAQWYENQGHTAPAHTYYLRAAERTEDNILAYRSLIRASFCYKSQGSRDGTEKILLENALNLLPERPEAYYFLSLLYERKQEWQNTYTYANLGLQCYNHPVEDIDLPEFRGKYLLIFQKSVAAWWWGKSQESRDLFQLLSSDYWDVLDDKHQKSVEDNISRLGLTPQSQGEIVYTKEKYDSLRFKFDGSQNIERSYSQILQDIFILSVLNGKRDGRFLEVGGARPFERNNTALLEQSFGWSGVSIELNSNFANEYINARKNTKVLCTDALTVNYEQLLQEEFDTEVIDYLQLDIEPAKNTFEVLLSIPFEKYKFAVITYEHDYYVDISKSYRQKSRDFLESKGYVLVVNDLSVDGVSNFEDWWVHPDLVDENILKIMEDTGEEVKNAAEYMYRKVEFGKKRRVIDYFRFFNEKELLELRYHLLKDKVDKFVIAQGTRTFSGNPTELLAEKYIKELNLPEDKFIIINVDLPENSEDLQNSEVDIVFRSFSGASTDSYKNSLDTRTRERMVMDGVISILSQFNDNDIFLASDCDEIIDPKYLDRLINVVVNNPDKLVKIPLVELQGKANLQVYDLHTSNKVTISEVSFICTKKHFNICTPTQLRYNIFNPFETTYLYKDGNEVEECGWHFSWMGDSNRKKLKCKSFAHYSDYIESAEVKDLGSSQMETFFDDWKPVIGGINPWGNKNLILKEYDENNLPKEIWQLKNVRQFLLDDSPVKEKTLTELFLAGNYSTDKYQLGYITEFYNSSLQCLKNTPINLLEIGTYEGGSAKLWRDYFHPESTIITGDIIDCKNKTKNVNYLLGDLYSDEIVSQFQDSYFNLIIDDGPHTLESFKLVIKKYHSKLKSNGTLIIEDVISESYLSPLIMLAKEIGYSSYEIVDLTNKQLNDEWKNDWKNGLYILRFDK